MEKGEKSDYKEYADIYDMAIDLFEVLGKEADYCIAHFPTKEFFKEKLNRSKVLYMIDMNNGFVNFGAMSNPKYNDLVPEQLKMLEKFKRENGQINFIMEGHSENSAEFKNYPAHCIIGTPEAEIIPEFKEYQQLPGVNTFYKNNINGMLNRSVQDQIKMLKNLREIVIEGVCADLCVMDFARTNARFLDEINKEVKIFVVRKAIDTFDAPEHNREEWLEIAEKIMKQAGIEIVDDIEELEKKEKQYRLKF